MVGEIVGFLDSIELVVVLCFIFFSRRILVLYIRFTQASHFSITSYIVLLCKWLYVEYIEMCFLVFIR